MQRADLISTLPTYAFGTREGLKRYLPAHSPADATLQQKYAGNLQVATMKIINAARPPIVNIPI